MHAGTRPDEFDLVVVGGGPAGSCAAYTAATAGLRTCVIDKRVFPRDKLCGCLITPRSRALFEQTFGRAWNDDLFLSSDRVSFYAAGRHLASLDGRETLSLGMRVVFDAYLLSLAEDGGAELITGDEARALDVTTNTLTLASGRRIRYGVLIGADGVSSFVARSMFGSPFDARTIGFGLEVEVPRGSMPKQTDVVEIDFAAARWGYGWVFPKRETFTIGVGGIHTRNPDLRQRLATYLRLKGLDISTLRVKGQYIPFGTYRRVPGRDNVLLAGDAAGIVDPITGEGIAYAMQTGRAAGRAAAMALDDRPASALSRYMPEYTRATKDIKQANAWRHLIFPAPMQRPFARAFARATTLQRGYLDIVAGKREYSALYGLFARQIVSAVLHLI